MLHGLFATSVALLTEALLSSRKRRTSTPPAPPPRRLRLVWSSTWQQHLLALEGPRKPEAAMRVDRLSPSLGW